MIDKQATFFATYGLFVLPIAAGSASWQLPVGISIAGVLAWWMVFSRDRGK